MKNDNDLTVTLTQALQDIKKEQEKDFNLENVNLADLERRTGISRAKLRRLCNENVYGDRNTEIVIDSANELSLEHYGHI